MNMVKLLSDKLPAVVQLLKKHKVKRAYAFGSAVAGNFTTASDIDLLIAFEDNLDPVEYGVQYFELADQLELLLNCPVDLVTELSLKNPYFISSINKSKVPLYE
ncbi:MAG: nucleotidyltransferase domain-containing protein [Cyclobacteriaceae bacterium]|nr:nucleotidyltransferase domain-containing protein [Cyclobacteriaceae bacterium]